MKQVEKQILELLGEVLRVTKQIVRQQAPTATHRNLKAQPGLKKTATTGKPNRSGSAGIFPHHSKYNPWRAYAWNPKQTKQVYLGAFSSLAKAKAARAAFLRGEPITTGTKAVGKAYRAALQLVA